MAVGKSAALHILPGDTWGLPHLLGSMSWSPHSKGFRVWGLGFRVWGLGFRVWGLGFRVSWSPHNKGS